MRSIIGAVFILSMIPQCAMTADKQTPPSLTLTEKDAGATVEVALHASIVLRLPAQLGTGYSWGVEVLPQGLRKDGESQETTGEKTVGGTDIQLFRFTAVAKGRQPLRLVYRQPWKGGATGRTFDVVLDVR